MLNGSPFKAIAHPVRRDILKRLRDGPMSAGELADGYDMSKPSLSAHFKALREAELIQARRDGNHIFYTLNLTVADELLAALMDVFGVDSAAEAAAASRKPRGISDV